MRSLSSFKVAVYSHLLPGEVTDSGVTTGGRGRRVAHPLKVWGEILEGRGKGGNREGRGRERKEEERGKEKGKIRRKRREMVKGEEENLILKMEVERHDAEQRTKSGSKKFANLAHL